ncbi:calcium-binding protein [Roseovarius mucosus]|uniref:calcium-binding protein n=1 Tax=Roseovarius mucosus TaxID=215743 RepID=UPI003BAB2A47
MAVRLTHVGTNRAANFEVARAVVAITPLPDGGFILADFAAGQSRVVRATAAGPLLEAPWFHEATPRIAVTVGDTQGALPPLLLSDLRAAWDAGLRSAVPGFLGQGGVQPQAATLLAARLAGRDVLIAAAADGQGLSVLSLGPDQSIAAVTTMMDSDSHYLRAISDIAVIERPGEVLVFAASAQEHGITVLRLLEEGGLEPVASVGRNDSLPIQTITALAPADIAGRAFLIVAAADSSSLTVLRVGDGGTLDVADHVIDGLATRFAGVSHLEVVSVDGHVFLLVAGRDAGLSLLRLTAEGRLLHIDTLADEVAFALNGVSGLAAQVRAGGIDILVTAAGEAGLSLFRVDLGPLGLVLHGNAARIEGGMRDDLLSRSGSNGVLDGAEGDDTLSDGPGADTLVGGTGADVFVLRADGQRDVIADFTLGEDRLDFSLWPMLRNLGQLAFTPTATGALLRFGLEEVDLRNAAGGAFVATDLPGLLLPLVSHFDVVLGPLQVAPPSVRLPPLPPPPPVLPEVAALLRVGGAGDDLLEGGPEDDTLAGNAGNDTLRGNAGNDRLAGGDGRDQIDGGAGHDNIGGGLGADRLYGQAGDDTIGGGAGDDMLFGGNGADILSGGPGNDLLEGGAGNDRLAGSFDHDTVRGGLGGDRIGGGPGRDLLDGGEGNDELGGGEADDTVLGGAGDDFLAGGGRNDLLDGGTGNDTLNAGAGHDRLIGGEGADIFVFNDFTAGERDVIVDFQFGENRIRLTGIEGQGPTGRFLALDIQDTDAGAVLRYAGHEILLEDVAASSLSRDDFIFL